MSAAGIVIGGLLFTAGHCVPIFRSGGRTRLTFSEWVLNHTIFGSPVEYVPKEDYARELEGIEIPKGAEMELSGTTVTELTDALRVMEDSLNDGGRARLQIASYDLPDSQTIDQFYYDLISAGFHTSKPKTKVIDGIPVTELVLIKGSPAWWALLIPIIPAIMIVGLVAFGITRIEVITKALMPLLLVAGGVAVAVVAVVIASPKAAAVAEKAITKRR